MILPLEESASMKYSKRGEETKENSSKNAKKKSDTFWHIQKKDFTLVEFSNFTAESFAASWPEIFYPSSSKLSHIED